MVIEIYELVILGFVWNILFIWSFVYLREVVMVIRFIFFENGY